MQEIKKKQDIAIHSSSAPDSSTACKRNHLKEGRRGHQELGTLPAKVHGDTSRQTVSIHYYCKKKNQNKNISATKILQKPIIKQTKTINSYLD